MAYAILRTTKLKSLGEIAGSLSHTYRTRKTDNADPARAHLNEHHGTGDPAEIRAEIRARLPRKRRKDAVLCLEYFVGASPEWFTDDQDGADYFAASVDWLKHKHGAGNVIAWSVHRDETSPHLVAYVLPFDKAGNLNCKAFTGGKAKLSAMQTHFAANVGAQFGLLRGIEGSKAKHTSVASFYAGLGRAERKQGTITPALLAPRTIKRGLLRDTLETPEQVAGRLTRTMRRHYAPAVQRAELADLERKRAEELEATARDKAAEVDRLRELLRREREELATLRALYLDGLTPAQQLDLADLAAITRERNAPAPLPTVGDLRPVPPAAARVSKPDTPPKSTRQRPTCPHSP